MQSPPDRTLAGAADIVAAYVTRNPVTTAALPGLIAQVHEALARVVTGTAAEPAEPQRPAVSPRKSVMPDYLVCLEDGKRFKSLKRHLRTRYGLTPEAYRVKWGLPFDYPMVAPNYAAARSELARSMGLGQQRRKPRAARG